MSLPRFLILVTVLTTLTLSLNTPCVDARQCNPPDICPWKYIDCHGHGLYNIEGYRCNCAPGWSGMDCSVCSNNSCPTGEYCDTTMETYENKHYNCTPNAAIKDLMSVSSTMFNCVKGKTEDLNTCNFQGFATPYSGPLAVNCTFTECDFDNNNDGEFQYLYQCKKTRCQCTDWCNDIAKTIAKGMVGQAIFKCHANKTCQFVQEKLPITVLMQCHPGECMKPVVKPDTTNWLAIGLAGGGAVIILFAIFGVHQYIQKREEDLLLQYQKLERMTTTVTWNDIGYTVKAKNKHGQEYDKQILKGCSGQVHPGELLAIIGPSGAGKTTLLDILADRKSIGVISGDVLVNGKPRNSAFNRVSGYVLQEDIMMPTLTVREHLLTYTDLRLPPTTPREVKEEIVDDVMEQLGISHIAHSMIGDEMHRGISGGERKRVNLASELVTDPSLLFMDEPTTGLDSTSASTMVTILKRLALEEDRTVVLSIHQPRSNIYHMFDKIMLLAKNGQVVYFGDADKAISYFDDLGYPCPANFNPADFLIDLINDQNHVPHLVNSYNLGLNQDGYLDKHVSHMHSIQYDTDGEAIGFESLDGLDEYATSFWTQFVTLSGRTWKNVYRNPYLMRAQYITVIAIALVLGGIYWQLSNDIAGIQNRTGALFFMIAMFSFGAISSLDTFVSERALFIRERANGCYRPSAYFLAKTLFDVIPMRVFPPLIFGGICYGMIGLRKGSVHVTYFLLILVLTNVVAAGLCLTIGAASPNTSVGSLVAVLTMLFFMLFGGFLLNKESSPKEFAWIKWLSFMSYSFESLVVNELQNVSFNFNPQDFHSVTVNGNLFLNQFGMDVNRFDMDIWILGAMAVLYLLFAYLILHFFVKERR